MAVSSVNSTDLEVLQRRLRRLLWLCRALKRSESFAVLCLHLRQDGKTVLDLEAEFTRRLALANAGSILSTAEIESYASWADFYLPAFEEIWAAVRFFENGPAGQAKHVA